MIMQSEDERVKRWRWPSGLGSDQPKKSVIRWPVTPVERWQRAISKVRRVRFHQGGSNLSAIRSHCRYLIHKDSHVHDDRLVCTIGDLKMIKDWDHKQEHYRFIIAPERGDVLDMERLTANVCRVVMERFGRFDYAGSVHEKRQSNGRLNKHTHLIIRDTFGVGASAFKGELDTAAAREATLQFEELGLHYLPNILDHSLKLEVKHLEHELTMGDSKHDR